MVGDEWKIDVMERRRVREIGNSRLVSCPMFKQNAHRSVAGWQYCRIRVFLPPLQIYRHCAGSGLVFFC